MTPKINYNGLAEAVRCQSCRCPEMGEDGWQADADALADGERHPVVHLGTVASEASGLGETLRATDGVSVGQDEMDQLGRKTLAA